MVDLVICDDQISHHYTLQMMIRSVLVQKNIEFRFACVASTADEVLEYAKEHTEPALYFLDICLDEKDPDRPYGIELCNEVLKYSPRSCIIYVSAYQQYALQCCQSHAFDFLVKPFDQVRLAASLLAGIKYLDTKPAQVTLTVQAGSRTICLDESEILYIESKREYCIAHCVNDTTVWRESFTSLLKRLSDAFIQIHRSYIVRIDQVHEFDFGDDVARLKGSETTLPISRRQKAEIKKRIGEVIQG